MFESKEFETQLRATVSAAAGAAGMKEYETAIVSQLLSFARENEPDLIAKEMRKAAAARRGLSTAYESARVVVKLASEIAASDRRTTVTAQDFAKAYNAQFCTIWPFCRSADS